MRKLQILSVGKEVSTKGIHMPAEGSVFVIKANSLWEVIIKHTGKKKDLAR